MNITCPGCGFTREVDEAGLSPAAAVATCPRCKERFRFRSLPASAPRNTDTDDDALPPGAVVPPGRRGPDDEELFTHPRDTPRERDGDERRQAAEAYHRAARLPLPPDGADETELDNPWENPVDGYLAAFYQTTVRVLFAAPRFFAGLRPQNRVLRPLMFYLLVGLVQILTERFWLAVFAGMVTPDANGDAQIGKLIELLSAEGSLPMVILVRVSFISLELLLVACLSFMMFRLVATDKANFSLIFQVIAYAAAPAVLGIVPLLGSFVGLFWSIACCLIGCRHALRVTWKQTLLALGPLYALVFFTLLHALSAVQTLPAP